MIDGLAICEWCSVEGEKPRSYPESCSGVNSARLAGPRWEKRPTTGHLVRRDADIPGQLRDGVVVPLGLFLAVKRGSGPQRNW